jgi:hypothetical protein
MMEIQQVFIEMMDGNAGGTAAAGFLTNNSVACLCGKVQSIAKYFTNKWIMRGESG